MYMQIDKSIFFYTDSKQSSLFVKIFTLRIYKKLSYVNIIIDILLQNTKQQFNYWLDPLEFTFWYITDVLGSNLTNTVESV